MDTGLLEISAHDGEGFKPLVSFGDWRVAILRFLDELEAERIDSMERHTETDEVFVLLIGQGVLILGGNCVQVEGIYPQVMEIGKIYNVKRNVWHTILLSRNAAVLLVENEDTGEHNSEYAGLSAEQRGSILRIAQQAGMAAQKRRHHDEHGHG
jgi:ureidoglycolate hydrolase